MGSWSGRKQTNKKLLAWILHKAEPAGDQGLIKYKLLT